MARELGPQGIHVAHFPIDGGVGTIDYSTGEKNAHWSRYGAVTADAERLARAPPGAGGDGLDDGDTMLGPDAIAEAYSSCTGSTDRPGPSRWSCGPGWRPGNCVHLSTCAPRKIYDGATDFLCADGAGVATHNDGETPEQLAFEQYSTLRS